MLVLVAGCGSPSPAEPEATPTPMLGQATATRIAYTFALNRSLAGTSAPLGLYCWTNGPMLSFGSSEDIDFVARYRNGKWIISSTENPNRPCTFVVDDRTGIVAWPGNN